MQQKTPQWCFFCCNDISVNGNDIRFTNDIANAMVHAVTLVKVVVRHLEEMLQVNNLCVRHD